jgi:hypothetical protein
LLDIPLLMAKNVFFEFLGIWIMFSDMEIIFFVIIKTYHRNRDLVVRIFALG